MLILVCNVGSTSLKYKLFQMPSDEILVEGKTERVGKSDAIFSYTNYKKQFHKKIDAIDIPDYESGIRLFLECLLGEEGGYIQSMEELDAIGFKTVLAKGFLGTHELTEEVLAAMEAYNAVAPAHNPPYIRAIRVFKEMLPETLMVGCFETAFHRTIPLQRKLYALPYEWYETYGIQKYGYHGASHGYIARQITKRYGETYKLISCHMGGSGSICAIENGRSVDTSFGFSLQTGIPHSNRSGDMDAYVISYLLSEGMELDEIMRGIGKEGGLLGISGVSNDLRDVQAAAEGGNARAALAVDLYCEAVVKYIGAYYAILGGLDYLVFTAGIGENAAFVREKICMQLKHLGIAFNAAANNSVQGEAEISAPESPVKVLVLPTNEEVGIATAIYEEFSEEAG